MYCANLCTNENKCLGFKKIVEISQPFVQIQYLLPTHFDFGIFLYCVNNIICIHFVVFNMLVYLFPHYLGTVCPGTAISKCLAV